MNKIGWEKCKYQVRIEGSTSRTRAASKRTPQKKFHPCSIGMEMTPVILFRMLFVRFMSCSCSVLSCHAIFCLVLLVRQTRASWPETTTSSARAWKGGFRWRAWWVAATTATKTSWQRGTPRSSEPPFKRGKTSTTAPSGDSHLSSCLMPYAVLVMHVEPRPRNRWKIVDLLMW